MGHSELLNNVENGTMTTVSKDNVVDNKNVDKRDDSYKNKISQQATTLHSNKVVFSSTLITTPTNISPNGKNEKENMTTNMNSSNVNHRRKDEKDLEKENSNNNDKDNLLRSKTNTTPEHKKSSTLCAMKCLTESLSDTIAEMDCQEYIIQDWSTWLGITNCCLLKTTTHTPTRTVATPLLKDIHSIQNTISNRVAKGITARLTRIQTLREENNTETVSNHFVPSHPHRRMVSRHNSILASKSLDDIVVNSRQYSGGSYANSKKTITKLKRKSTSDLQEGNLNDQFSCMIAECMEPISFTYGDKGNDNFECVYKDTKNDTKNKKYEKHSDLCYDSDPGTNSTSNLLFPKDDIQSLSKSLLEETNNMYCDSLFEDDDDDEEEEEPFDQFMDKKREKKIYNSSNLEVITSDDFREETMREEDSSWEVSCSEEEKEESKEDEEESEEEIEKVRVNRKKNGNSRSKGKINITIQNPSMKQKKFSNDHQYEKIQQALNETWLLTWHPTTLKTKHATPLSSQTSSVTPLQKKSDAVSTNNRTSASSVVPVSTTSVKQTQEAKPKEEKSSEGPISQRSIQLWFERGNRIRKNDIVEPKLMWRDAYHPDLVSKRKLNVSSTSRPYQICLLSICRIIETTQIDRKKYPFAKTNSSFVIKTCDNEEFLFEAENENERNRTVNLWKLVVARLASQAVIGNGEEMLGEFFVSPNNYYIRTILC